MLNFNISKEIYGHHESNLGLLGEKQECYLCALQPLHLNMERSNPSLRLIYAID